MGKARLSVAHLVQVFENGERGCCSKIEELNGDMKTRGCGVSLDECKVSGTGDK